MKKHLTPVTGKFARLGFDVRTRDSIVEEKRQEEAHRQWTLRRLAARYDRQMIYDEIWSELIQHVAKRYGMSDVGLGKTCKKLKMTFFAIHLFTPTATRLLRLQPEATVMDCPCHLMPLALPDSISW
jgi:hypothetical protein